MPLDIYKANALLHYNKLVLDFTTINFLNNVLNHSTNIIVIGNLLYTQFFPMFFVSGVILLVSMIGAISLTLHRRNDIKRQLIFKQVEKNFGNSIIWRT